MCGKIIWLLIALCVAVSLGILAFMFGVRFEQVRPVSFGGEIKLGEIVGIIGVLIAAYWTVRATRKSGEEAVKAQQNLTQKAIDNSNVEVRYQYAKHWEKRIIGILDYEDTVRDWLKKLNGYLDQHSPQTYKVFAEDMISDMRHLDDETLIHFGRHSDLIMFRGAFSGFLAAVDHYAEVSTDENKGRVIRWLNGLEDKNLKIGNEFRILQKELSKVISDFENKKGA